MIILFFCMMLEAASTMYAGLICCSENSYIFRTSAELGPLEKRLLDKKNELKSLTLDLTAKQKQLETFKDELTR